MTSRLVVEAGATWTRLSLSRDGKPKKTLRLPAPPLVRLAAQLRQAIRRLGLSRVDVLVVGAKGAWAAPPRRALAAAVRPLASRAAVMSDAELAWREAFPRGAGVLVIAGTGSVAVAARHRGRLTRSGGLGPLLGDEGSAFWIGREALNRMPDAFGPRLPLSLAPLWVERAPEAVRRVAALCPIVMRRADGDPRARRIRAKAAQALAALADSARRRAALRLGAPVRWHGSLFRDQALLRDFASRVRRLGLRPAGPACQLT